MSESTAVSKKPRNDLASIISSNSMKKQWALVLPKCLTPDRLARVALTQLRKTPKLAQCSQESFLGAMMKCAETGLEPNGRDAHLVPYGKECTFIADYKGLVRLARRDPDVKDVQVFTIRENDSFTWSPDGITHSFDLKKSRGEVVGCYTKISWMNGTASFGEPMTRDEAEAIKKGSPSGRNGPWVSHFIEMWKKSVVRRDSKMWPLSPEIQDQMSADMDDADGIEVSAPSYEENPLDNMSPADVTEEPEESSEPAPVVEDPEPVPEPEPEAEPKAPESKPLKPVNEMNKTECGFEIKQHITKPYYKTVAEECGAAEFTPAQCPLSMLQDIIFGCREAAGK